MLRKKLIRSSFRHFLKQVFVVESAENGSTSNSVGCRDAASMIVVQHGCAQRPMFAWSTRPLGEP